MQTKPTVTFHADDLKAQLPVLLLDEPVLTKIAPGNKERLCRVDVTRDAIACQVPLGHAQVHVRMPARAESDFSFTTVAHRFAGLRSAHGELTFELDDDVARYRCEDGESGTWLVWDAELVPPRWPSASAIGGMHAASLDEILTICEPFLAESSVKQLDGIVTAGNGLRSVDVDLGSPAPDWVIRPDILPHARRFVSAMTGDVQILSQDGRLGLASQRAELRWSGSLMPEVMPMNPAIGRTVRISTEALQDTAEWMFASTRSLHDFVEASRFCDLKLENGAVRVYWRVGHEFATSRPIRFEGDLGDYSGRLALADLLLLVRCCGTDTIQLTVSETAITTTETRDLHGATTLIRRSVRTRMPT